MTQVYPAPSTNLNASGFVVETNGALSGSIQGPTITGSSQSCGGAGSLIGAVSNKNVTFSLNPGGTVLNFTGVISGHKAMSGTYSGFGGACFSQSATSGTFTAQQIPPLNGSFTGTFVSTNYMPALIGTTSAVPVSVSGTLTQGSSEGGSVATLTGEITAVDYPCFTTASLTGTISGNSAYLSIYSYDGEQIGTIGNQLHLPPSPAVVGSSSSGGLILTSSLPYGGFYLGVGTQGPCPAVYNSDAAQITYDSGNVTLNFQ